MPTYSGGLGRHFDIAPTVSVQDLGSISTTDTGNRVSLEDAEGVTFVFYAAQGDGTTDDISFDLQEYPDNLAAGQDLNIVTDYWTKEESGGLGNDETWSKVTQAEASEITDVAGSQEAEQLYCIEVRADQLTADFTHVGLSVDDTGSTDVKYGGVIAILWGLKVQRTPENLRAPQ